MANTTVDSRHEALPTEAQRNGPRALESRAAAVGHVARGGFLSLLGLSMGLSADFAGLGHWSVYLLAGGIATVGLATVGRAARHLWRFGSRRAASFLSAFTGLGAGALLFTVGQGLVRLGLLVTTGQILTGIGILGSLGFIAVTVLLTLWTLVQWMRDGE